MNRPAVMRLYDTPRGEIVSFEPGPAVAMYSCGITPYDAAHVGHAQVYLTFDLLQRRLLDMGHQSKLVRNVTDVDDDILRKARELGCTTSTSRRRHGVEASRRNPATYPGISHQSSRFCRLHHRRHLPPALADRAVLQSAEAEPAHQDLRGHQPQRPADSNLDRSDRAARAQVPATARSLWLESVQSRRFVAPAVVRLSRPDGLDR